MRYPESDEVREHRIRVRGAAVQVVYELQRRDESIEKMFHDWREEDKRAAKLLIAIALLVIAAGLAYYLFHPFNLGGLLN